MFLRRSWLCRVVREGDAVVFRDFNAGLRPKNERQEFRVSSASYDSVIADIMKQVTDYQARTAQVAGGDGEQHGFHPRDLRVISLRASPHAQRQALCNENSPDNK